MTPSPHRQFLARAALWLYPRAWRERYAEEVRDLIEARGVSGRDVIGLVWRGVVELAAGRATGSVDWGLTAVAWRMAEGLVKGCVASGAAAASMLLGVSAAMAGGAALGAWNWFPALGVGDALVLVPTITVGLLPTALLFVWPGLVLGLLIARRSPVTARIVVVGSVSAWLSSQGVTLLLPGAVGGWIFAATLFPSPAMARASAAT